MIGCKSRTACNPSIGLPGAVQGVVIAPVALVQRKSLTVPAQTLDTCSPPLWHTCANHIGGLVSQQAKKAAFLIRLRPAGAVLGNTPVRAPIPVYGCSFASRPSPERHSADREPSRDPSAPSPELHRAWAQPSGPPGKCFWRTTKRAAAAGQMQAFCFRQDRQASSGMFS